MDCFRLRISVGLTVFSPSWGKGPIFLVYINEKRISLGNLRSLAAPELGYQQTGMGTCSGDELASLASSRKNASHASWHDRPLHGIRNDTNTMQAAYHLACELICTQTEGLDPVCNTGFTRLLVEISGYQQNFPSAGDEFRRGAYHGIQCESK